MGPFLYILGLFLNVKVQNGNIFRGSIKFQIIVDVPKFQIFGGE